MSRSGFEPTSLRSRLNRNPMLAFKYNMQPGVLGANLEDVGATCTDRCSVTQVSFDVSLYSVLLRKRRGRQDIHAHIHAVCKSRASPSHSLKLVKCCFTSTETVGLLGTGAQGGHLDFHTAPVTQSGQSL